MPLLQCETFAQIQSPDIGVRDQIFRTAGEQDLAVIDDARPVDDIERLAHIMVGDQDANAAFPQLADQIAYVGDRQRIDTGKGLVQEDDRRACR